MEEDDTNVSIVVVSRGDEAAVHVGVPTRLVDNQLADGIGVGHRVAAPVEDSGAGKLRRTIDHDAKWLPGCVVIGNLDWADDRRVRHQSDVGVG